MGRTIRNAKRGGVDVDKPATGPGVGRWLLPVLVLAVTAAGVVAGVEYIGWNNLVFVSKLPPQLVGKWVVEGGEQDGATFDFYRNGRMIAHINMNNTELVVDATVRVEGDVLYSTTRHPQTGQEEIRTHKIRRLDERSLVLDDPRGVAMRMSRAE